MVQRSKLKPCKNCQKPVTRQEKICPYCGTESKKGFYPKLIIGIMVLILFSTLAIPTKNNLKKERQKIATAVVDQVNSLELAKIFNKRREHTDSELLNNEREITGKIIEWQLKVFVITKMPDHYRVVTHATTEAPGTLLTVYPQSNKELRYLEGLKPGNTIKIKGKIEGTLQGRIKIDPAFLI